MNGIEFELARPNPENIGEEVKVGGHYHQESKGFDHISQILLNKDNAKIQSGRRANDFSLFELVEDDLFEWLHEDLKSEERDEESCSQDCFVKDFGLRDENVDREKINLPENVEHFPEELLLPQSLVEDEVIFVKARALHSFPLSREKGNGRDGKADDPENEHRSPEEQNPFEVSPFPTDEFEVSHQSRFRVNNETLEKRERLLGQSWVEEQQDGN